MGLLDKPLDKALEKLELRFGDLRQILQDMLVELREIKDKLTSK